MDHLAADGEIIERRIRTEGERFAALLGDRPRARILIEAPSRGRGQTLIGNPGAGNGCASATGRAPPPCLRTRVVPLGPRPIGPKSNRQPGCSRVPSNALASARLDSRRGRVDTAAQI
jgi:hypothetical protein